MENGEEESHEKMAISQSNNIEGRVTKTKAKMIGSLKAKSLIAHLVHRMIIPFLHLFQRNKGSLYW